MAAIRLDVGPDEHGLRLDRFLTSHVEGRTRSAWRRLIAEGSVCIDGRPAAKPGVALAHGMCVEVALPAPDAAAPEPEALLRPLDLVYEDAQLVVVNKPAGLVVHPGHGRPSGTLVNALLAAGVPLAPAGGVQRPGIVHRLDEGTSGLLVVAKTDDAHRALSVAFAQREVRKDYDAIVWGHPSPAQGTVARAIGRHPTQRVKMAVGTSRGRPAVTHYRTVETLPGFARLALKLDTGRTHQIRVHLQSLHHAVVGDVRYGGRPWKGVQHPRKRARLRALERLALHACDLTLRHPSTGRELTFHADLPDELEALLAVLRER